MVFSFREQRETSTEVEVRCEACNGTGLQPARQPSKSTGRRIYPAKCAKCAGKGRLKVA